MSSRIPKKVPFDKVGFAKIKTLEDFKKWFEFFMNDFDGLYSRLYDHLENRQFFIRDIEILAAGNTGLNQTGNWRFVVNDSGNFEPQYCESPDTWVTKYPVIEK